MVLTKIIENIAIALKPIGLSLAGLAAFLFLAMILLPNDVSLTWRLVLSLICFWCIGLSLVYLCYCPGAAASLFIKWRRVSLISRVNRRAQLMINIFIVSLFPILILISARIIYTLIG